MPNDRIINFISGVPIVNVRETSYSIGYGEKALLNCFITPNPSVTNVYWEREVNGTKHILNNLTMGIQGVSRNDPSLVLMESTKSDIGTYRCVAINDVGTGKSETLSLMVVGGEFLGSYMNLTYQIISSVFWCVHLATKTIGKNSKARIPDNDV